MFPSLINHNPPIHNEENATDRVLGLTGQGEHGNIEASSFACRCRQGDGAWPLAAANSLC
jgi:hypothetical protein